MDNSIVRRISHPIWPPPPPLPPRCCQSVLTTCAPAPTSAARYNCQPYTVAIALTRPHYYYTALQNGTLSAIHQIQNLYTERKKPPYAKHKINANECRKLHSPK